MNLPELDDYETFILGCFHEWGPCKYHEGHPVPRDYDSVNAYDEAVGSFLNPWDKVTLVKMSEGFVSGRLTGEDVFGIEPFAQYEEEHGNEEDE